MEDFANPHSIGTDLLSVIVPVYNAENHIRQCIESVLNQSYKNLEVILVNDGSTDKSGDICDAYSLSDDRIRVVHTRNNGPASARNAGINKSCGEFIFFIDADDIIDKNALSALIEIYNQHKSDIIVGDFNAIKNGNYGPGYKGVFPCDKKLNKQDVMNYARSYLKKPNRFTLFAYSWGRLFKASIIKSNNVLFNTDLHTFEDVAFNFNYLRYANEVLYLAKAIYGHQVHDNYMSATMTISGNSKRMFGYGRALADIGDFLEHCGSSTDIKKEVGHAYICLTIIQLVRICGQMNNGNKKKILELVRGTINDPDLRDNLKYYSPTEGDSRIVPVLMKLKLVWPIMLVCRFKARKRYGKGAAAK